MEIFCIYQNNEHKFKTDAKFMVRVSIQVYLKDKETQGNKN